MERLYVIRMNRAGGLWVRKSDPLEYQGTRLPIVTNTLPRALAAPLSDCNHIRDKILSWARIEPAPELVICKLSDEQAQFSGLVTP